MKSNNNMSVTVNKYLAAFFLALSCYLMLKPAVAYSFRVEPLNVEPILTQSFDEFARIELGVKPPSTFYMKIVNKNGEKLGYVKAPPFFFRPTVKIYDNEDRELYEVRKEIGVLALEIKIFDADKNKLAYLIREQSLAVPFNLFRQFVIEDGEGNVIANAKYMTRVLSFLHISGPKGPFDWYYSLFRGSLTSAVELAGVHKWRAKIHNADKLDPAVAIAFSSMLSMLEYIERVGDAIGGDRDESEKK